MADSSGTLRQGEAWPPRDAKSSLLLAAVLFVAAWLPRLLGLGTFITWDELMWVYRSVHFAQALYSGDWAATFRIGHPGVVTTWLGALGIAAQRLALRVPSPAEWTWLLQLPALDPHDAAALQRLAPLLVAAKIPLTLVAALAVVGCWALARRLVTPGAALLGALLLAFDPFSLALSRVLHLDALLSSFMTLGLLSLMVYLRNPTRHRWLLLSAFATGLAALTKTPALALIPLAVVLLLTGGFLPGRGRRIRGLFLWSGIIIATYIALWPAMWVAPLDTLHNVVDKALSYAAEAEETADFFRGTVVSDPGGLFYPLAFVFRASPVMLLGLLSYPLLWRQKDEWGKWAGVVLLAYAFLYVAVIASGAKKFDRYALPLFPPMNILAAMGWACLDQAATRASRRYRGAGSSTQWMLVSGAALILAQALLVLPSHPHYLAWYNPLLGGLRQAVRTLPVGWGEGLEKAAAYLNSQPDAEQLTVASAGVPGMAPKFWGRTLPLTPASLIEADYVVIYVSDRQGRPSPVDEALNGMQPEHIVHLQGIEYAWVYRNESYRAILEVLASEAAADDAVLIAGPSLVAQHYDGPWPHTVLQGEKSEAEVASTLQHLAAGRRRIWYVRFPERTSPAAEVAYYILTSEAYRLREGATLSLYQLPEMQRLTPTELRKDDGPFTFGDQLQLTRYGIADASIGWGQQLGAQIAWQAVAPLEADCTAFLHLVDHSGHMWGQVDLPLQNRRGEHAADWLVGVEETIRYLLPPWAGISPGRYELLAGIYRSDTQQPLSARDAQGVTVGHTVSLGPIQVIASAQQPTTDELLIPQPLQKEIGGVLLLGYGLSPPAVPPGASLKLDLFWRVLVPPEEDYALSVTLNGRETRMALPNPLYPSSRWQAGEMLRGQFDIPVPVDLPSGEYALRASLIRSDGQPLSAEAISLGVIQVIGRTRNFEAPTLSHPLHLRLGDRIRLLGYDLSDATIRPGTPLHLTVYWQAQGPTDVAYTVFVHILEAGGHVVAQKDSPPQDGEAPTTGWLPGEVIVDEYHIPVPSDLPSGPFQVEVGMYDPATGERLPIRNVQGERLPDDRVLLAWLERE